VGTHAIGWLLLPNRPVLVDTFTPKEAVLHHGHSEEQNQEKENRHEEDRDDSRQVSLLLRVPRRVHILIHPSRLNSSPRAMRDPSKNFRLAPNCLGHFKSWRAHLPRARAVP
jgi:hypothetical protein